MNLLYHQNGILKTIYVYIYFLVLYIMYILQDANSPSGLGLPGLTEGLEVMRSRGLKLRSYVSGQAFGCHADWGDPDKCCFINSEIDYTFIEDYLRSKSEKFGLS